MSKQIRATFESIEEAQAAKRYLREQGFERVSTTRQQVAIEMNDEDWIAAFELVSGLGGDVAPLFDALEQMYRVAKPNDEDEEEPAIFDEKLFIVDDSERIEPRV